MKKNNKPQVPKAPKKIKRLTANRLEKFYINLLLSKEKTSLVENLTLLLAAGLSITLAIQAVKEELKTKVLKKIVQIVQEDVDNGSSLWRALNKVDIFNPATIALVRVGEETGRLAENLKIVSEQNEKTKTFKGKIKSALMYPVFVMMIAVVVAIGVAWFILPNLAVVFSQMNVSLPLITKLLIGFGQMLQAHGQVYVPIFIIFMVLVLYFMFLNRKTKFIGQTIIFVIPGLKDLILEVEIGRFGYLLGTLLQAGIPIEEALESVSEAADFYRYQKLYALLKKRIIEGDSFQKSFAAFKKSRAIFPRPVQQMIIAGEQSGRLSEILIKIGKIYEEKTELTTKNLVTILEPLLLIVVWLGVVTVALAIILPIYSLIGNLNAY